LLVLFVWYLPITPIISDGIMSLEWSASSEWILMSGNCDGAIRFWDIRRAGCFRVLDQSQSQLGRRPPLLERTTEDVNSLSLITSVCFRT
jgi:DNA excision repair protein ERCC-8